MTTQEKHQAFQAVCKQVRAIEQRGLQEKARAMVAARYAGYEKQREAARQYGGFSLLK